MTGLVAVGQDVGSLLLWLMFGTLLIARETSSMKVSLPAKPGAVQVWNHGAGRCLPHAESSALPC